MGTSASTAYGSGFWRKGSSGSCWQKRFVPPILKSAADFVAMGHALAASSTSASISPYPSSDPNDIKSRPPSGDGTTPHGPSPEGGHRIWASTTPMSQTPTCRIGAEWLTASSKTPIRVSVMRRSEALTRPSRLWPPACAADVSLSRRRLPDVVSSHGNPPARNQADQAVRAIVVEGRPADGLLVRPHEQPPYSSEEGSVFRRRAARPLSPATRRLRAAFGAPRRIAGA